MSDNLRRYFAIQKALKSLRPTEPKGNGARHLHTLAMLIAGIIGSQKCPLPAIAKKVPNGSKPQSRVRRLERFLVNEAIDTKTYYLPYVQALLASLPAGPLALVIDGSEAGRHCVLLSINVVYKKRALPLGWLVVKGKKGHLSEQTHIQLVHKVAALLPSDRRIVFLGDGEFDGVELLSTLQTLGWNYVCRTAKNVVLTEAGERFAPSDLLLAPGDRIELAEVGFTAAQYGPVLGSIVWETGWKDPLLLVSNLDFLPEAYGWYKRRFRIEIIRNGSRLSDKGSDEYFTGSVRIDPLFKAEGDARASGGSVTFEPGARTAWHTHPLGQTLIVTWGCGWAQREGGPIEEIRPGDVVRFLPGEKHWHGATATTAVTHFAIQEHHNGKVVEWMEKVADEQYQVGLRNQS